MTVALVALASVCIALTASLVVVLRQTAVERVRLINAVLARNPGEFAQLQRSERPKAKKPDDVERQIQVGA